MTTRTETPAHGARVIYIPPPLYYVAALVGGLQLHKLAPLAVPGRPTTAIIGAVLCVSGLGFAISGVGWVVRHRTTIVPHRPVATLLTTGPYRYSRNPMYTGLAVASTGAGLSTGSWWPILAAPLAQALVTWLVVKPEETYLAARFGESYAHYRASVRRWL